MTPRRHIATIAAALLLAATATAQEAVDSEMQRLMRQVASLRLTDRQQQRAAWDKAATTLDSDEAWTMMDEIVPDNEGECAIADRTVSWFALNRILARRVGHESTLVRGDFNNGEDPNFCYSLIERSVRAGASVSYELRGREGQQQFVVMPFDPTMAAQLTLTVSCGAKRWTEKGRPGADGNLYVTIPQKRKVNPQDVLTVTIANRSTAAMAFVLLNHNTRNR